ncbi:amidase [Caldanaerobacter subterraneus]|uniref:Amidase n=1 Tax=Caldanaerobacter subterraneus TaxID=911092 RepID=A0A4V2S6M9_9THEO|nr:amidase [Caldanaerobacter subterraneus]TCO56300.1 hypothetical protein EV203_13511 [Caldanaerobacter subterraneus]
MNDKIVMQKVNEMARLAYAINIARDNLGYSVRYINYKAIKKAVEALKVYDKLYFYGVKNTSQIKREYLQKLSSIGNYIWLTVDEMSKGGRAIDIERINPVTGRPMTGSTSAGCINVLLGINDFAIGTDGGGSVLGPAMSCNLYSIMAKGLGLEGKKLKKSTDGINFIPGIGIIAKDLFVCKDVLSNLIDLDNTIDFRNLKVGIPREGDINLPIIGDVREDLYNIERALSKEGITVIDIDLKGVLKREDAIYKLNKAFEEVDIVITKEGPIDIFGLGDSVLGTMGYVGSYIQNSSGKYLLKVANMVNATALTIPSENLGVGILIMAKEGNKYGTGAVKLAEIVDSNISHPKLFYEYFNTKEYDDILFEVN